MNKGKGEADPDKRLEIYKQAERIIQEDVGYIPVVYRVDQYAFKPWVKDVAGEPAGVHGAGRQHLRPHGVGRADRGSTRGVRSEPTEDLSIAQNEPGRPRGLPGFVADRNAPNCPAASWGDDWWRSDMPYSVHCGVALRPANRRYQDWGWRSQ